MAVNYHYTEGGGKQSKYPYLLHEAAAEEEHAVSYQQRLRAIIIVVAVWLEHVLLIVAFLGRNKLSSVGNCSLEGTSQTTTITSQPASNKRAHGYAAVFRGKLLS